jgi:hypothetical protein
MPKIKTSRRKIKNRSMKITLIGICESGTKKKITFTSVIKTANYASTNPRPSCTGCFCTSFKLAIMLFQAALKSAKFNKYAFVHFYIAHT